MKNVLAPVLSALSPQDTLEKELQEAVAFSENTTFSRPISPA